MKSIKKRSKLSAIFDIRYIFYDFVKLTGVIPILLIFRLKTYCFNKKKKELFNSLPKAKREKMLKNRNMEI